jgi:hypothetical protein
MELLRLSGRVDGDADAAAKLESRVAKSLGSIGAEPSKHLKCSKGAGSSVCSLFSSAEDLGGGKLRFPSDSSRRGWDGDWDAEFCGYANFDVCRGPGLAGLFSWDFLAWIEFDRR